MSSYTAFILSDQTRENLLKRFPPKFDKISADHITHEYGVEGFGSLWHADTVKITGYVTDNKGLEALIVEVDGKTRSPQDTLYHITLSFNPKTHEAKDSNIIIDTAQQDGLYTIKPIDPPITIETTAALRHKDNTNTYRTIPMKPAPLTSKPLLQNKCS